MTSLHIERVRGILKDKKYWEACCGVKSEEMIGATYCYYIDETTLELLAVHRMK
jgi:hypothetical protein